MNFNSISLETISRRVVCALVLVAGLSSQAIATPTATFHGDTDYQLSGSFNYGTFGLLTFSSDSTLHYDTLSSSLIIDAKVTSNVYHNEVFNLDFTLGSLMLINGATDSAAGSAVNVVFPSKDATAKFLVPNGVQKNGYTMVGTLEGTTDFNLYNLGVFPVAAGYDFPVLVNMPAEIRADSHGLRFDAWLKTWGDGIFGNIPLHYDTHGDIHVRLTEIGNHCDVPEPMSMTLLATGLLGSALARRRSSARV